MDDRFHLGVAQGADGGFDDIDLALFFLVLLSHGSEHLEADDGCAVLAQNDVVDVIGIAVAVEEYRAKALPGDLNRGDDGIALRICALLEAERRQIHVFLGGEDGKQPLVEAVVDEGPDLARDQFIQRTDVGAFADAKDLALSRNDINI